jgi:hypothetical protein
MVCVMNKDTIHVMFKEKYALFLLYHLLDVTFLVVVLGHIGLTALIECIAVDECRSSSFLVRGRQFRLSLSFSKYTSTTADSISQNLFLFTEGPNREIRALVSDSFC